MKDEKLIYKETEILNYIRSYCKIKYYSTTNSTDERIQVDYNLYYSMYYDIETEGLIRFYYGYKVDFIDLSIEFKKYQRKTKLENLNKIL